MADSREGKVGERTHTSFSADIILSAYDAEKDGVRHLFSIPAVRHSGAAPEKKPEKSKKQKDEFSGPAHAPGKRNVPAPPAAHDDTQAISPREQRRLDRLLLNFEHQRLLAIAVEETKQEAHSDAPDLFDSQTKGEKISYWSGDDDISDLVRLCFRDAMLEPLLTPDKEQDLFREIDETRGACAILLRTAMHTAGDMMACLTAFYLACEEAADDLKEKAVMANMRLVISIAARYRHRGVSLLDRIQQGYIGLMRAVEGFEWQRGLRFSTYAVWWIRQSIMRGAEDTSTTIRIPAYIWNELSGVRRAWNKFLPESGGIEPTEEELAAALEWDTDKVEKARLLFQEQWIYSLDAPIRSHSARGDSEDTEFGELVADTSIPSPEDEVVSALTDKKVRELVDSLSPREAEIIRRRFGIGGNEPESLEKIAADFGLTRERIRQIEMHARVKLMKRASSLRE